MIRPHRFRDISPWKRQAETLLTSLNLVCGMQAGFYQGTFRENGEQRRH